MQGGRSMLLEDECAGADPADCELLVSLNCDLFERDARDACEPRAVVKVGDELGERLLGALGVNVHAAVLAVAHPAHEPECARTPDRRFAKPNALHATAHDCADRLRRGLALIRGHSRSDPNPDFWQRWVSHMRSHI